ncbi:hypothetical protein AB1Y20_006144 [Prymnesium parvum]|uniref:RNA helicase n=1 Tax=Prymnesium parvum TaxID=97485 RepID=A0AB34J4B4_PRYPA|mmetsp:Transcript_30951/g.70922  ORF Transcript_30951/g.70922 Transcript_30951/m.70922 type:complete len:230 (-) Transcript_30951:363-1052(-)
MDGAAARRAVEAAVQAADAQAAEQALRAFPGGLNGTEPPDYVASRPIHAFVEALPRAPADRLKALVAHVFSLPGLNLTCRALPHGYLSQKVAASCWDPRAMKTVLTALATARGLSTSALLAEAAPLGGKPTPSSLFLALMLAIDNKDSSRVRVLLELGAPVDQHARDLLEKEPVKPVDLTVEWIQLRNTKAVRKRLLRVVDGEADESEEEAADQEARRSKRQRHRQYFK